MSDGTTQPPVEDGHDDIQRLLERVVGLADVTTAAVTVALAQALPSGIIAVTPTLALIDLSAGAARILGTEPADAAACWAAITRANGEALAALARGEVLEVDLDLDRPGRRISVKRGSVMAEGAVVAHLLSLRDDTARALAEAASAERDIQFEAVINAVPSAVWSYGEDGSAAFISGRWTEITGQTIDAWRRDGWQSIIHPDDLPPVRAAWAAFLAGAPLFEATYRIIRPDTGEERVLVERGLPIVGVDGVAFAGVTDDLTARVRAEAAVRERTAQIEALTRAAPSAVWSHRLDGELLFSNGRWMDLTGQPSSATGKQGWAPVIHPDDLARVRENWRVFEAGAPEAELRHTYRVVHLVSGEEHTLKEHAVFAVTPDGAPIAIVGATHDVTDEARATAELRRHIAELEALTATLPTIVWRFTTDGTVTYCSDQWQAVTGRSAESALGDGWLDAVDPADRAEVLAKWEAFLRTGVTDRSPYRVRHVDGGERFLSDIVSPVLHADGTVAHYMGTSVDVTDRHHADQKAQVRAIQHAVIARLAQAVLDAALTAAGLIELARQALVDAGVRATIDLAAGDLGQTVGAGSIPIVADGVPIGAIGIVDAGLDADDRAFLATVARVVGTAVERRRADDATRYRATHDSLTGLGNRDALLAALADTGRDAARPVALLFCDLDNFKLYNDSLGHALGDRILIAAAGRIRATTAPGDVVIRLGGDEFVILTIVDGIDAAVGLADRITAEFRRPLRVGDDDVHLTTAIGVAIADATMTDPLELLRDADAAMYAAKRAGTGRVASFTAAMRTAAVNRLALERALRTALEADELVLHYQPIVSLDDEVIVGFEALIRWQHPTRGLVPPDAFIPIAEASGLILPIGAWVIETACEQAARWNTDRPDARPLTISVNVSGWQLLDGSLPVTIARACRRTGIEPTQLAIEITETVLFTDVATATESLAALRRLGVEVWLDDFGTGYSSLAYIRRFPLTGIKLDRSFIAAIATDRRDREIVRAVAAMARALDLPITAEGIETANAAATLQALGCDRGQGYHYSRPIAASATGALVTAGIEPDPA
jgi:diguanylate cyclase (GGDEF)-like protein/PAS domain S-box-containing protein